jgi:hypothetical protein
MSRQKGTATDMKERAPAFQFYPRQFAADEHVMAMDLDAVGAHILLICAAAASPESYRIATDERAIRNRLRNPSDADWERIKAQLLAGPWKISEDGRWWEQHGLRRTVEKQKTFSESQRQRVSARYTHKLPAEHRKSTGKLPDGLPGSYSSSSSSSSNLKPRGTSFTPTEIAHTLCRENFWSGRLMIEALKSSVEYKSTEMPECSLEQVGEWLATSYTAHKAEKGERAADPLKYFQQAMYPHSSRKPVGMTSLPANDPAKYALSQMEGD